MRTFEGVTVDPPGAADLDDAIHVARDGAGWLARVAIPRCGDLLPIGGEADAAAAARGFTTYGAQGIRQRMLPADVASALSLTPGEPRDAILVTMPLSSALSPGPVSVERASFASGGRLTYDQATRAIRDPGAPHHAMLSLANDLAARLAAARAEAGAIGLRDLGDGAWTDEEGRVLVGERHAAQAVVRELMIRANASLAALCAGNGVAILFRNHRARATASRQALAEDLSLVGLGALRREAFGERVALLLGRARLGPTAEGHWALNLPAYAHFTSPIRRYADVVNQRILEAWVDGRDLPYGARELADLGARIDATVDSANEGRPGRLKEAAAREAAAAVRRGEAPRLDRVGFTGAIKASVGAPMRDDVAREALARLRDGRLTSKDVARLLEAGDAVGQATVDVLADRPHEAVSALNYLAQARGWLQRDMDERARGPSHAPAFGVVATVVVDGTAHVTERHWATTAREARQRATLAALALACGLRPPPVPAMPDTPVATSVAPSKAPPDGTPARNRLQERCQSSGWPMPAFSVERSGPPHAPVFTAVATLAVPGRPLASAPATGRTRKDAEAAASSDLLGKL